MNKTLYVTFLFFFLLFLQVLILNNILFFGYTPYLYISFIFLYPVRNNRFPFLILSFLLGLFIDAFTNLGGVNAFATLFIAYIRVFFIRTIFRKTSSELDTFNIKQETFDKVFNFVAILTLTHHFLLHFLTNFSFHNFTNVLLNTVFSTVFTLILYFLGSFIFSKKDS